MLLGLFYAREHIHFCRRRKSFSVSFLASDHAMTIATIRTVSKVNATFHLACKRMSWLPFCRINTLRHLRCGCFEIDTGTFTLLNAWRTSTLLRGSIFIGMHRMRSDAGLWHFTYISNNIAGYWRSVVIDLHNWTWHFQHEWILILVLTLFWPYKIWFRAIRIVLMYDLLPFSYSNFPFESNKIETHETSMPFPFITSREVLVRNSTFSLLDKLHLLKLTKKALRFQLSLGQTDAIVTIFTTLSTTHPRSTVIEQWASSACHRHVGASHTVFYKRY